MGILRGKRPVQPVSPEEYPTAVRGTTNFLSFDSRHLHRWAATHAKLTQCQRPCNVSKTRIFMSVATVGLFSVLRLRKNSNGLNIRNARILVHPNVMRSYSELTFVYGPLDCVHILCLKDRLMK
jgi:hypothetical protein